ncbi:uncharacterized protein J3R85_020228 [Psidium guajava]|nr:uncharacterized protein J3R85_020228 [Psidium guajava]
MPHPNLVRFFPRQQSGRFHHEAALSCYRPSLAGGNDHEQLSSKHCSSHYTCGRASPNASSSFPSLSLEVSVTTSSVPTRTPPSVTQVEKTTTTKQELNLHYELCCR